MGAEADRRPRLPAWNIGLDEKFNIANDEKSKILFQPGQVSTSIILVLLHEEHPLIFLLSCNMELLFVEVLCTPVPSQIPPIGRRNLLTQ